MAHFILQCERMQTHLGIGKFRNIHLKAGRTHPGLDRTKEMFSGFSTYPHTLWFTAQ